ncbi:50S ribosomal protein L13 [Candidatus Karelsulcia muelleri]
MRNNQIYMNWYLINALNKRLGRLASIIAHIILGKHQITFSPHLIGGDKVIIINANKLTLAVNKIKNKTYISYSGYPGGQKVKKASYFINKQQHDFIIRKAVLGMLPTNSLKNKLSNNLYIFNDNIHKFKHISNIKYLN